MTTVDQATQKIQLPVMENLFNIPIKMPESSGILKEWENCEKMSHGKDRQKVRKQVRRKWRIMKEKENSEMDDEGKKISEMNKKKGKKDWTLLDEDDDQDLMADGNKRLREHKDSQDADMNEVVVANLKLPQKHQ